MLNKLKKVVGATMLTGMMVYLMGTIVTYANNYPNTPFEFNFNNSQCYTTKRDKTDTSKMYMKCTSITSGKSYTAHAVGYNEYYDNVAHDCSRGKTYKFNSKDQYYYMTNWVRENGYRLVQLQLILIMDISFQQLEIGAQTIRISTKNWSRCA